MKVNTPVQAQPVARQAVGTVANDTTASFMFPILFPFADDVTPSIPLPPFFFPFAEDVTPSLPLPPFFFPFADDA